MELFSRVLDLLVHLLPPANAPLHLTQALELTANEHLLPLLSEPLGPSGEFFADTIYRFLSKFLALSDPIGHRENKEKRSFPFQ